MRSLVAFALSLCPLFALAQQDDPRFKTVVPFDARYLPLSELGTAIAKSTGVPITVEAPIAARKVAIFATDRSLGEVMARVADTLFLQWVAEENGYRLRLDPDVAKEEQAIAQAERRLEESEIRRTLRDAVAGARTSLEAYRQAYRDGLSEYEDSLRDKSEAGKKRSAELNVRLLQRFPSRESREPWDRGRALAQLDETGIQALLNGQPFFAASKPMAGIARLPADAPALLKEMGMGSNQEVEAVLLSVWRDPGTHSLLVRYRSLGRQFGALGTEFRIEPLGLPAAVQELGKLPLILRLNEWAKGRDEGVMKRALDRPAEPPTPHPTNVMTGSDLLRWLHRKTGLPMVGDAFRVAVDYANYPEAGTVEDVVKALTPKYYAPLMPPVPYVRSEGGWLMMRHRRFWRRLRAELPERALRPLEAKAAARTPLTLEDYAGLIAGLSPEQLSTVTRKEDFVVDFPTFAFKSLPAIRLWAGLPAGVRTAAQKNPIPLATLNGSALMAARAFVADRILQGFPAESWLPALLPGGSGVPEGATLYIRFDGVGANLREWTNVKIYRYNEFGPPMEEPFAGWQFKLEGPDGFSLSQDVALHPVPRDSRLHPPGSIGS
ncbi:MAG: hypothetical protein ACO1SV_04275 [Fimbriimonas sp.]